MHLLLRARSFWFFKTTLLVETIYTINMFRDYAKIDSDRYRIENSITQERAQRKPFRFAWRYMFATIFFFEKVKTSFSSCVIATSNAVRTQSRLVVCYTVFHERSFIVYALS